MPINHGLTAQLSDNTICRIPVQLGYYTSPPVHCSNLAYFRLPSYFSSDRSFSLTAYTDIVPTPFI